MMSRADPIDECGAAAISQDNVRVGTERIFGLDLMRALAVSGVFYSHVAFLTGSSPPLSSNAAATGVMAFFVLSGFLVGAIALDHLLDGDTTKIQPFLIRRWSRTLPAYFVFLAINLCLVGWGKFDWKYLLFLQTMGGQEPLPYMNESWTLAIEEWFYLLLPFALLALVRVPLSARIALVAAMVIGSILVRYLLMRVFGFGIRDTYHITFLNAEPLVLGVCAAYLYRAHPVIWRVVRWPSFVVGIAVLAIPFSISQDALRLVLISDQVAVGAALLLPVATTWRVVPAYVGAAIAALAMVSYSLYFCHIPMAVVLRDFGVPQLVFAEGAIALWVSSSLVVAAASYWLIERPGMRVGRKLSRPSPLSRYQAV